MEQKKRSYEKWTADEVEEEMQRDFKSATRSNRVCGRITNKLAELNIERTLKQIREKLTKCSFFDHSLIRNQPALSKFSGTLRCSANTNHADYQEFFYPAKQIPGNKCSWKCWWKRS
ncbi:hypothetical protein ABVT39_005332 [Epinephelus coioides]